PCRAAAAELRPAAPTVLLYTRFNEFDARRGARLLAALLRARGEARLEIVGDGSGPDGRAFLRHIESEGFAERAVYHGMLEGRSLRRALQTDHVALWLFD